MRNGRKLGALLVIAALVLIVTPLIGVGGASEAEAAEPMTVKAAAATTSYNPTCENADGSYNGRVCKTTFPAYKEDLSDEPTYPEYLQRPGKTLRNYPEQVTYMNDVHAASVASCKSYVPYIYLGKPSEWTAFCNALPKPTVGKFTVKDVITGVVR